MREILIDRAISSISCSSEEIRAARETLVRQFPAEGARQKWLEETKITEEQADGETDLKKLALEVLPEAKVFYGQDKTASRYLCNGENVIFMSGGDVPKEAISEDYVRSL